MDEIKNALKDLAVDGRTVRAEYKAEIEKVNKALLDLQAKVDEKKAQGEDVDPVTKDGLRKMHEVLDKHEEIMQALESKLNRINDMKLRGEEKVQSAKDFKLMYAMKGLSGNGWERDLERKAMRKIVNLSGMDEKRLLDESSSSYGRYLIPEEFSADFVDALYGANIIGALPFNRVRPAYGKQNYSSLVTGTTAYWVASGAEITPTSPVIGNPTMEPHKMGILAPVANELLRMSSPAAEQVVKNNMLRVAGLAMQDAIFEGSGSGAEPDGLFDYSGINEVSMGTDGAKFESGNDIQKLMEVVRKVEEDNGIFEAWVMHPITKWDLREVQTATGGDYIMTVNNNAGDPPAILGYPYYTTSTIKTNDTQGGSGAICSYILGGQFSTVTVGIWQDIELEMSAQASYTLSAVDYHSFQRDETLFRLLMSMDVMIPQPAALCQLVGIIPNTAS